MAAHHRNPALMYAGLSLWQPWLCIFSSPQLFCFPTGCMVVGGLSGGLVSWLLSSAKSNSTSDPCKKTARKLDTITLYGFAVSQPTRFVCLFFHSYRNLLDTLNLMPTLLTQNTKIFQSGAPFAEFNRNSIQFCVAWSFEGRTQISRVCSQKIMAVFWKLKSRVSYWRFLQINQLGLVPAITDGDLKLSEGAAILIHIAETRGLVEWYPRSPAVRAKVCVICFSWSNQFEKAIFCR